MPLSAGQRRFLRGLAHRRKATVWMGRHGLGEALLREVDSALDVHELIKVKLAAADRDDRDAVLDELCRAARAELVQRVGNVATLYRRRREDPAIRLPGG